jgi:hypothetical protein
MILKQNSVSAKVYRNFYETSHMPQSICPYFWKLVFAWPITILLFPLLIPFWIVDKINGDSGRVPFPAQVFIGILIYGAAFCIFCLGVTISSIWITHYQGTNWYGWYIGGILVMYSLLVVGVILLIREIKLKLRIRRIERRYDAEGNYINAEESEIKPNIIVEFIKAKYNKYCPKIDWK